MKYILAFIVLTFSMQSSADSWLCTTAASTGLELTADGSWKPMKGLEVGTKWSIAESDWERGVVYAVRLFDGDDNTVDMIAYLCGDFVSEKNSTETGMLVCDGYGSAGNTFKYDPRNGQFVATFTDTDSPLMDVGRCSKR